MAFPTSFPSFSILSPANNEDLSSRQNQRIDNRRNLSEMLAEKSLPFNAATTGSQQIHTGYPSSSPSSLIEQSGSYQPYARHEAPCNESPYPFRVSLNPALPQGLDKIEERSPFAMPSRPAKVQRLSSLPAAVQPIYKSIVSLPLEPQQSLQYDTSIPAMPSWETTSPGFQTRTSQNGSEIAPPLPSPMAEIPRVQKSPMNDRPLTPAMERIGLACPSGPIGEQYSTTRRTAPTLERPRVQSPMNDRHQASIMRQAFTVTEPIKRGTTRRDTPLEIRRQEEVPTFASQDVEPKEYSHENASQPALSRLTDWQKKILDSITESNPQQTQEESRVQREDLRNFDQRFPEGMPLQSTSFEPSASSVLPQDLAHSYFPETNEILDKILFENDTKAQTRSSTHIQLLDVVSHLFEDIENLHNKNLSRIARVETLLTCLATLPSDTRNFFLANAINNLRKARNNNQKIQIKHNDIKNLIKILYE